MGSVWSSIKFYNSNSQDLRTSWKTILLWSNHFYGICAALLATESSITLLHQWPSISILLFIYLSTVVYYTHAYLQDNKEGIYNERSSWYKKNSNYLRIRQSALTLIVIYLALVVLSIGKLFLNTSTLIKGFIFISAALSLFYYMPSLFPNPIYSFRNKGFLKSLSIAWVWSITCCFVPIWLMNTNAASLMMSSFIFWMYFAQLFTFIFILAILFDIKDLNRDQEELVKTVVVRYGVAKTLSTIMPPLLLIYFFIGFYFSSNLHLGHLYLWIQLCLVVFTFLSAKTIILKQSIHANILLIDGLMIIKAILSIFYFA